MNELQVFTNDSFGDVRTTTDDNGKILFCGKDVATALGYSNVPDALSRHCRCIVKCDVPHPQSPNKTIEMSFITEGDVYRLTFGSKLPSAEKFTDWVADEILPTIRKHGAYMTEQTLEQALTSPDFLIQLATQLKEEKEKTASLESTVHKQNELLDKAKPLVCFANCVKTSETSILVGEFAKILRQNGVEIGQKRLFTWLRDNGYLIKNGCSYNMPTQKSMELGLFEIKETIISHSDGHTSISRTPKITGRGQIYFVNKFVNESELTSERV